MPPLSRSSSKKPKLPRHRSRKRHKFICRTVLDSQRRSQSLGSAPFSLPMSKNNPERQTFADLGITQPEQLVLRFAELRTRFDLEAAAAQDESSWKQFR